MVRVGGHINGQLQSVYVTEDDPRYVRDDRVNFTGSLNGSDISIDFADPIYEDVSGTLEGDTLSLAYPNPDGTLETVEGRPATVEDYNEAARGFRARVQASAPQSDYSVSEACVFVPVGDSGLYHDPASRSRICVPPSGYEEQPTVGGGGGQIPPNCAVAPDQTVYCTPGEALNAAYLEDLYYRGLLPPNR